MVGQRVRRRRGGTSIITASYGARRASSWPHMVAHIAFDMAIYMGRYMDNDHQPPWLSFAKVFNFCFISLLLKSIMVYGSTQHAILRRYNRVSHKWKESYEMSLLFYPILVFEGQWLVSLSMVVSAADTSVITLPILTPCHVYPFLHHHHH